MFPSFSSPPFAGKFFARWRKQICAFLALFVLVVSATAAEAPEIKRRYNNSVRVRLMHPYMQPKIGAILSDLERSGEYPVIHPDVYRSVQKQAQLKRVGFSKVGYSFHMVTDRAGGRAIPASFAADIIDNYKGYAVPNSFWLKLIASSEAHDLTTGIYWGLPDAQRKKIRQLAQSRAWGAAFARGWDPAHVQPNAAVLTLGQAKRGKRPPLPKTYRPVDALIPVNPRRVAPSGHLLEQRR